MSYCYTINDALFMQIKQNKVYRKRQLLAQGKQLMIQPVEDESFDFRLEHINLWRLFLFQNILISVCVVCNVI